MGAAWKPDGVSAAFVRSPPAEACARLPAAIARKTVSLHLSDFLF